jgi:hypothetical protein
LFDQRQLDIHTKEPLDIARSANFDRLNMRESTGYARICRTRGNSLSGMWITRLAAPPCGTKRGTISLGY